jgi:lactoylglutathione lyase
MAITVSQVSLYYQDQDAALRFWADRVGFEVIGDMPYGQDRWIEVAPPGGGVRLVLSKASPDWPSLSSDKPNYVLFEADDIVKAFEELKARGVEFTMEPKQEAWGWSAVFTDPEGHLFHLGQKR